MYDGVMMCMLEVMMCMLGVEKCMLIIGTPLFR